jgi:hypothetical protein
MMYQPVPLFISASIQDGSEFPEFPQRLLLFEHMLQTCLQGNVQITEKVIIILKTNLSCW